MIPTNSIPFRLCVYAYVYVCRNTKQRDCTGSVFHQKKQLCHSIERKEGEEKGKETRVEEAVEYMSFPQRKEKKEGKERRLEKKYKRYPPSSS